MKGEKPTDMERSEQSRLRKGESFPVQHMRLGKKKLKSCAQNMKIGAKNLKKSAIQRLSGRRDEESEPEGPETILQTANIEPAAVEVNSCVQHMRLGKKKLKSCVQNMKVGAKNLKKSAIQRLSCRTDEESEPEDAIRSSQPELDERSIASDKKEELRRALGNSILNMISHAAAKCKPSLPANYVFAFPVAELVGTIEKYLGDRTIEMDSRDIATKLHLLIYKDLIKMWKRPDLLLMFIEDNTEEGKNEVVLAFLKHLMKPQKPSLSRRFVSFFFHRK